MRRFSMIVLLWLAFLLSTVTIGCDDDALGGEESIERTFTFDESAEGWTGDIVDYPTYRTPEELEFVFERRSLPPELDAEGMGLYFAGRNTPDDLFMYAKRKLSGLQPRATYRIDFRLDIASNSPSGCVGIGGPPGEAVRVLVGAADVEPTAVVEDDWYRLNVNKDPNERVPGKRGAVAEVGNVANGVEQCTGDVPYRTITRTNAGAPVEVTADENGFAWVFVGTDSGFEGKTTLFYDTIQLTITG